MCFLKLILGVALFKKCVWQKEKHLINLEHSSILERGWTSPAQEAGLRGHCPDSVDGKSLVLDDVFKGEDAEKWETVMKAG